MGEKQIKHMVDRFLGWYLPKDFNPDAGISYEPGDPRHLGPSGTNLLDAAQAEAMVRYMVAGMSGTATEVPADHKAKLIAALRKIADDFEADLPTLTEYCVQSWRHPFEVEDPRPTACVTLRIMSGGRDRKSIEAEFREIV